MLRKTKKSWMIAGVFLTLSGPSVGWVAWADLENRMQVLHELRPLGAAPFKIGAAFHSSSVENPLVGSGLHFAVDLYAPAGTPAFAVLEGQVKQVVPDEDDYVYTLVVIHENGIAAQYTHIDPRSIPADVRRAIRERSSIPRGTHLGNIVQVGEGESVLDDHLHFALFDLRSNHFINPLPFLAFEDRRSPVITAILVKPSMVSFYRGAPEYGFEFRAPVLTDEEQVGRETFSGKLSLAAITYDELEPRRLKEGTWIPPHRLFYEIVHLPQSGEPRTVFSRNYLDASLYFYERGNHSVSEFVDLGWYQLGLRMAQVMHPETDYSPFYANLPGLCFALTSKKEEFPKLLSAFDPLVGEWDTTLGPDGAYRIEVTAGDTRGNRTTRARKIWVRNH